MGQTSVGQTLNDNGRLQIPPGPDPGGAKPRWGRPRLGHTYMGLDPGGARPRWGQTLNDNRWHDVAVVIVPATSSSARSDLQHTVHVDNTSRTDWSPRSTLSSRSASAVELFVGGVTPGLYHSLPKQVSTSGRFKGGWVSRFLIGSEYFAVRRLFPYRRHI